MKITRGKLTGAQKVVIYGPEGIGKSTFAAQFPVPLFIDTEGGTRELDIDRAPTPSSWTMLLDTVREFTADTMGYKTLVLDTADWAEQLCIAAVCARAKKSGIEDFGYGKGYVYVQEEFGKLLNMLSELVQRDINVVLLAHAKMRTFQQPDEMGSYDRWELKVSKNVAPIVKEWADMVLFMNYKTVVIHQEGTLKSKAQGGQRVVYTSHHPCWDAKNRHGLPEEMPIGDAMLAVMNIIERATPHTPEYPVLEAKQQPVAAEGTPQSEAPAAPAQTPEPIREPTKPSETSQPPAAEPEPVQTTFAELPADEPTPFDAVTEPPEGIPKALADLMVRDGISEAQIRKAVYTRKGVYPESTPLAKYDEYFISGWVIPCWNAIVNYINNGYKE